MLGNKLKTTAKVVDGKLILSLPNAITPIVWQMDLTEAKSSAFEVVTGQEAAPFSLASKQLTASKAEAIASFEKKQDAVNALMATSKALENASGHIRPNEQQNANVNQSASVFAVSQKKNGAGKWLFMLVFLVLIGGLISTMVALQPRNAMNTGSGTQSLSGDATASNAGVPMSADDFLRNR